MIKKILSLLIVGVLIFSIFPACSNDKIEIAVVPKSLDNAIFLDTKNAAEAKAKELGIKLYREAPTTANPDLAGWFFAGGWPYFADPDALLGCSLSVWAWLTFWLVRTIRLWVRWA